MAEEMKLNHPWLVAAWPGMGAVALSAGYYLMAKLGMHLIAEFEADDLFDVEYVLIKGGLVQPTRRPRSRLFLWPDTARRRDIVVFIGEAQPPLGKYAFCRKLVEYAQRVGVERVYTFAAMATQMHPQQPSRVFAAATSEALLDELREQDLQVLEDGNIGGLNGVLLGVAAEKGLPGACLLGEMPHIFSNLPFPKASVAVLRVFQRITGITLDLSELEEQAQEMEHQLGEILSQVEERLGQQLPQEEELPAESPAEERRLRPEDEERIEKLFAQAAQDRSKAFELKNELDRLGVFKEYEDRFLDLFKK